MKRYGNGEEEVQRMKYEIKGETLPAVVCYLDRGEQMITEKGSMCWMSPNMRMETTSKRWIWQGIWENVCRGFLFPECLYRRGRGMGVHLPPAFRGESYLMKFSGRRIDCPETAFLASEAEVELSVYFQKKLGSGIFGGEGFIHAEAFRQRHGVSGI